MIFHISHEVWERHNIDEAVSCLVNALIFDANAQHDGSCYWNMGKCNQWYAQWYVKSCSHVMWTGKEYHYPVFKMFLWYTDLFFCIFLYLCIVFILLLCTITKISLLSHSDNIMSTFLRCPLNVCRRSTFYHVFYDAIKGILLFLDIYFCTAVLLHDDYAHSQCKAWHYLFFLHCCNSKLECIWNNEVHSHTSLWRTSVCCRLSKMNVALRLMFSLMTRCSNHRERFAFKSYYNTEETSFPNLPCYVNTENLCMLLSLIAIFILKRSRCKCTGTFIL